MLDFLVPLYLDIDKTIVKNYKTMYPPTHQEYKIHKWFWRGGEEVSIDDVKETIMAVMNKLDFVPTDEGIMKLVLETISVESGKGKHTKQIKGPALGIIQMEPSTYNDLLQWMKRHPRVGRQVESFMDKNKSEIFNLQFNVPYQISLILTQYYRYNGELLSTRCYNKVMRFLLYKSRWNTLCGATTFSKYIDRTKGI